MVHCLPLMVLFTQHQSYGFTVKPMSSLRVADSFSQNSSDAFKVPHTWPSWSLHARLSSHSDKCVCIFDTSLGQSESVGPALVHWFGYEYHLCCIRFGEMLRGSQQWQHPFLPWHRSCRRESVLRVITTLRKTVQVSTMPMIMRAGIRLKGRVLTFDLTDEWLGYFR